MNQDKLWSTVKTPHKDSKKHHGILSTTCIESPSGPSTVRNTVFRQLGYFVFSDGQVDRQQFTLNKVIFLPFLASAILAHCSYFNFII